MLEIVVLLIFLLIGIDEDVLVWRIVVEMDVEFCGDLVVYFERGRNNELNFIFMLNDFVLVNFFYGLVFDDIL